LLSGSRDLTARLWDLETGRELAVLAGHRMSVSALAFAANNGRIATGSWDDTVRLWDADRGSELGIYGNHPGGVHAVAFSPDHRTLAVLSGGAELRFWNLATGREAGTLLFDAATGLGRLRFSPQGNWLAVVSPSGHLRLLPAPRHESEEFRGFR
jgi:WD40 repeat protein